MSVLSYLPPLFPDPSTVTSQSRGRVVVAVHGTLSEPAAFRSLARALAARGVDMRAPAHGRRATAPLDVSARDVARAITSLPGGVDRVDVVGHSSGALVALRALRCDPAAARRVDRLVGLGAAWRGTDHRSWYRPDWLVRRLAGDSFVELEDVGEPVIPAGVRVTSIVSDADTVVPGASARLGSVIEVSGVAHAALPRLTETVLSALDIA
ncbi:esterase/lipase family protein [Corynebacterium timonense]|uniref:Alpha/beta hydrolase family protein n=1 Tax=Corynebacterium timonense TaxID=441500 RepID=A0A1H1Q277_9CORY|nr:alpha/beta fold hydrolase [Corynebacterium timonense]SDS17504.1 Alpha/beta hydrolase family protein [Corynebacterium timonense]